MRMRESMYQMCVVIVVSSCQAHSTRAPAFWNCSVPASGLKNLDAKKNELFWFVKEWRKKGMVCALTISR